MTALVWFALLLGGLLAGFGPVAAMAVPRRLQVLAVAGTLLVGLISIGGLIGITLLTGRVDESVVAGFLGLASALGGFAMAGAILVQIGPDPPVAELPTELPEPVAGAHVVLLSDAEPEYYEPGDVARQLRELADAGVTLPPEAARAFIFAAEKSRYRAIGTSPARDTVRNVTERLGETLGDDAPGGVTVAWCDAAPRLDESVAFLAGRGARSIVVAQLGVAENVAIQSAKRRVDVMRPAARGLRITYAQPLWTSAALAERVAERILEALGDTSPEHVGVALLGHGVPSEIDELHPASTEQETFFHQRIRARLCSLGIEEQRVRLGWLEWQEPGLTEVVRHLAALGCTRIVVAPASMPTDALATLIDARDGVAQARVQPAADVVVLPAWGDDPVVAEALAAAIRDAEAELPERS